MANPTPPTPTATPGAPGSTLSNIEIKVRRLTRSPSPAQLSAVDLDNYINTFVVYDFPEHLRTFNLRTTFSFFTNPGQDTYNTDIASFSGAINNPLYNFQNLYITVHPPAYIAGYPALYTQSPQQFYNIYPQVNNISKLPFTGNGTAGPFIGQINSQQTLLTPAIHQQAVGLVQGEVLFSAYGSPGTSEILGMALVDVPVVDGTTGFKLNFGNLYDPNSAAYKAALATPPTAIDPNNFINYYTGQFLINFPMNTIVGSTITSQVLPQILAKPQAILYYSNEFTIRPVPNNSYRVNFEVYQRPTALLSSSQSPELEEYWQFIAYGTAKKIFEDRMDLDSVQLILPEYNQQLRMCLRKSIVQYTNERVATIYTENNNGGVGGWGWGNGNGGY